MAPTSKHDQRLRRGPARAAMAAKCAAARAEVPVMLFDAIFQTLTFPHLVLDGYDGSPRATRFSPG